MKKISIKSFIIVMALAFSFASIQLSPYVSHAEQTSGTAEINIALNGSEYLNMLTNQYVIDYARAQSLKSKMKKASPDQSAGAVQKYENAAAARDKSLNNLLNSIDMLIASEKYADLSVYLSSMNENYPAKYTAFKPVFAKLKENVKFRITTGANAEALNAILTAITGVEQNYKTKKNQTAQNSEPSSDITAGGNINSSTATNFSDEDTGVQTSAAPDEQQAPENASQAASNNKQGEKEWTFMVYMNADNDLESSGIKDINEMETVGSDGNLNIVVQCDRSPEYDESNGNWVGARRFYIEKDSDFSVINSRAVENVGDSVDMGDPAVLLDFIKWGVKNYPAKKYALVIWNHGSGWKFQNARFSPVKGISYDESSGNHLDNFKLTQALAEGVKANGGKKFDILIMDACLMAMIEIAYQIKDCAKIYIASEEVAPADGMPYDMILTRLAARPQTNEKDFAASMIEDYVRSYKGGSQGWSNCTFSAFDLSNIEPLAEKIDALSNALINKFDALSYPILLSRLKVLKYSDADYADLAHFCQLIQNYSNDAEISTLCDDVLDLIGRPDMRGDYFETFNSQISITSEREGSVRWSVNNHQAPPAEYISDPTRLTGDKAFAETPLVKNVNGSFSCFIGPFNGQTQINSVEYAIYYSDGTIGEEKTISSSNAFFTRPAAKSEKNPVIIAEGHSQSLSLSRGISIYLTPFEDYLLGYKNLDFSKKFAWSKLISYKPIFKTSAKVLVVPDTGYASSDIIYSKFYHHALMGAGINYDLYLPAIYGELEEDVLSRYKDGVIIWYTAKNANCISKYEESILARHMSAGGRVFINGQNIEQHHGLSKFFTENLGALYLQDTPSRKISPCSDKFSALGAFEIGGGEGADNVSEPSTFNLATDKAQKIFSYENPNEIAGIKNANVIFCGFSFESIASGEARSKFIKAVIDSLLPAEEVKVNLMEKF